MDHYCKVMYCRFPYSHTTYGHYCSICKKYGHGQMECNNIIKMNNLIKYDNKLPESEWCKFPNCFHKFYHKTEAHHCEKCNKRNHSKENCHLNKKKYILKCPICNINNVINLSKDKIFGLSEECKICHTNEINIHLSKCGHACLCLDCMNKLKKELPNIERHIIDQHNIPESLIKLSLKKFKYNNGKIYLKEFGGMGCIWFIRRKNLNSQLEAFFLHSDNQGQYGSETNHIPYMEEFIREYKFII